MLLPDQADPGPEHPHSQLVMSLDQFVIKAINLISGYVIRKEFVALHTVMNKVTGVLLFVLPLTVTVIDLKYSGAVVCAAATFAAIQEGHFIRTRQTFSGG